MPPRRHCAPVGGGLGTGTPRRAGRVLRVVVERTGGVIRATDRMGGLFNPLVRMTPPVSKVPEPAGQRAFPSSSDPRRGPSNNLRTRTGWCTGLNRYDTRPGTAATRTLFTCNFCTPLHTRAARRGDGPAVRGLLLSSPDGVYVTTNLPPKVPLGGSLFPLSSFPRSLRFAYRGSASLFPKTRREPFLDEVTQIGW